MLTVGSLFSGIGGFDLGLERAGMQVKWQVEIDPYCLKVLDKHWPYVRRYTDIKQVDWSTVEPVDLVCGGFPCQPFSNAGKRKGAADNRNLWPDMLATVEALRPTWVLGENVAASIRYIRTVCKPNLEALGYRVRVYRVPACAVGAFHERQRAYIVAYCDKQGLEGRVSAELSECSCEQLAWESRSPVMENAPSRRRYAQSLRCPSPQTRNSAVDVDRPGPTKRGQAAWQPEPNVGRVADGVPARVDRLRSLGNAVVPQVVEWIGRQIVKAEESVV